MYKAGLPGGISSNTRSSGPPSAPPVRFSVAPGSAARWEWRRGTPASTPRSRPTSPPWSSRVRWTRSRPPRWP